MKTIIFTIIIFLSGAIFAENQSRQEIAVWVKGGGQQTRIIFTNEIMRTFINRGTQYAPVERSKEFLNAMIFEIEHQHELADRQVAKLGRHIGASIVLVVVIPEHDRHSQSKYVAARIVNVETAVAIRAEGIILCSNATPENIQHTAERLSLLLLGIETREEQQEELRRQEEFRRQEVLRREAKEREERLERQRELERRQREQQAEQERRARQRRAELDKAQRQQAREARFRNCPFNDQYWRRGDAQARNTR